MDSVANEKTIWLPYKQNMSEQNFYNLYNYQPINASLWMPGHPSLDQTCVMCDMKSCQTRDCWTKHAFFCSSRDAHIVAKVRGLCNNTPISLSYYPGHILGSFAWLSIEGTYIIYNSSAQNWQIRNADSKITAQSPATFESLLLGIHDWTFINDYICLRGNETTWSVSLALCKDDQFACDSGGCTNLTNKCDGVTDCSDGSDELNCKVVYVPNTYIKMLNPCEHCQTKTKVNVTFEVINVLNVDVKKGTIRAKFCLSIAWYDSQLSFLDLWWYDSEKNLLSDIEMNSIWKPVVEFENSEMENFDYHRKPEIIVNFSEPDPSPAPPTQLYNSLVYKGEINSLILREIIRFVERISYSFDLSCIIYIQYIRFFFLNNKVHDASP
jgi:hypothetical protein